MELDPSAGKLITGARQFFARTNRNFTSWRVYDRIVPAAFCVGVVLAIFYHGLLSPAAGLTLPSVIKITKGETLEEVGSQLQEQRVVRSARVFELTVRLLGGNRSVKEGSYYFSDPQNLFTVAVRFTNGDFELQPARIVIAEGDTVREIAKQLSAKVIPFDTKGFLALAKNKEGNLYPDTYFFYPGQDPQDVISAMENNFNQHLKQIAPIIGASKKPISELLKMASILVGEARTDADRKIVAGIMWKRIELGMPLQVDAPFGYIMQKRLTDLNSADLRIDSPYNTYINKGLPPTPIGNPSIEAIAAAAAPTKTNYLYYLSDTEGVMHYSTTFEQHKMRIVQYLQYLP